MAFTPAFTIGQNPISPNIVVATDISSDSDVAITQRRIYVQDVEGNYLVSSGTTTDYTAWAYADSSISLNILTQDTAVSTTVQWLDVDNVVLYTLTQQYCLPQYAKQFLYYLVQLQAITPTIPSDTNYDSNVAIFWSTILGAINAVTVNNDIAASQNCLDRTYYMQQEQLSFFG